MNTKFQLRVQRYGWDAAAKIYDKLWQENLAPAHRVMFEMADLNPGESVLEIACGSGFVTLQAAAQVGAEGHILASDISAEMIALLQKQAVDLGLSNIQTERIAAEDLGELANGSFDAALCALGLMFLPDSDIGVKAMWQALKPGSRAVAAVWGQRNKCAWADIFPIVDSTVKSEVCPLFFSLGAGDSLANSFAKQGFESIQTHRIETTLDYDKDADLLGSIIDGGAVALAAKRFDDETRQQVESEFLDSVSEYCDDGQYRIPAEFVVASGVKPGS